MTRAQKARIALFVYFAARTEHAFLLRNEDSLTFREIGLRLGVNRERARQMVAKQERNIKTASYEAAARANGWEYSPTHGGWVHDLEVQNGEYQVQPFAAAACWYHDIKLQDQNPE